MFTQTAFGPIHESWVGILTPVQAQLDELTEFIDSEEASGWHVLPARETILRSLRIPFDAVRVVIVGQDPYPTPGHAQGLAFSVAPDTQSIPRSLNNIFTEMKSDLGLAKPATGDLSMWAEQGVLLLNRVLTVRAGESGSHRAKGWEVITECVLRALDSRLNEPLVAILWGNDAQSVKEFMPHSDIIESAHPSPLSATRGFLGSRPFIRTNWSLITKGQKPINWSLD
jgi:uracil-DNA glycosylase